MPVRFDYYLYDTKDKGLCVGVFDKAEEAAKFVGITLASFYCGISRNNLLKDRYEFMKLPKNS